MSDQMGEPKSTGSDAPIAFFAITRSRTLLSGPFPGVEMSHTATAHDVVDSRVSDGEYIRTS